MTPETVVREHHLTRQELRVFFADRRHERDMLEARGESRLDPVAEPPANED